MRTRRIAEIARVFLTVAALLAAPCASALTGELEAELLAFDGSRNDSFGRWVAVDGDIAVIAAVRDAGPDDCCSFSGSAYVYMRTDTGWHLDAKLIAPDYKSGHFFGSSVAVSGDTIVIGATGDGDFGWASGAVYVFVRTEGNWNLQAKLYPLDAGNKKRFGSAVAIEGDTILVGAYGYPFGIGQPLASAYVFTRHSSTWTQEDHLIPNDGVTFSYFGAAVALSGNVAVIGAPRDDDNGIYSGSAYVFSRSTSGWSQDAKLLDPNGAYKDFFGASVAVDGDTIIVGEMGSGFYSFEGSALVFTRTGTTWSLEEELFAADGFYYDLFGASVAIDGGTALIGAPRADSEAGFRSGKVYVFRHTGESWSQQSYLVPPDESRHASFGTSVGLDEMTLVVGADGDSLNGWYAGSAYVFSLRDSEPPLVSNTFADPNPVPVDLAVSLSATIDDSATGGTPIASATYSVDGEPPQAMMATDGVFDSAIENVYSSVPAFSVPGVHSICVSGVDMAGNVSAESCVLVAVFDPTAGFVTGGGWINSPAGAYVPDMLLTGKANFGFVSKYKKGAITPTGSTQFVFHAGGLNFHSDVYDWLVVNQGGANAQYKGTGTINDGLDSNGNSYRFMLWAGDGENLGTARTPDTFRIRIWSENNGLETVVYDNGVDQPIGGGSIVIHSK